MAITIWELGDRPRRETTSENKPAEMRSVRYWAVQGASSESAALRALQLYGPARTYQGAGGLLVAGEMSILERNGPARLYKVEVSYQDQQKDEEERKIGDFTWSFDTMGRNLNRKQSLKTLDRGGLECLATGEVFDCRELGLPAGTEFVPGLDFGGAIGVSSDGEVAGVDVPVPNFLFEIDKDFDNATLTFAYADDLEELTGKMNKKDIHGLDNGKPYTFKKGELLFLGARGTVRKQISKRNIQQKTTLNFKFWRSRNRSNFVPGQDLKPVAHKYGWDYLWFYFSERIVTNGRGDPIAVLPRATDWSIERVVEFGDFSKLRVF